MNDTLLDRAGRRHANGRHNLIEQLRERAERTDAPAIDPAQSTVDTTVTAAEYQARLYLKIGSCHRQTEGVTIEIGWLRTLIRDGGDERHRLSSTLWKEADERQHQKTATSVRSNASWQIVAHVAPFLLLSSTRRQAPPSAQRHRDARR
jgi:hypothetical protein